MFEVNMMKNIAQDRHSISHYLISHSIVHIRENIRFCTKTFLTTKYYSKFWLTFGFVPRFGTNYKLQEEKPEKIYKHVVRMTKSYGTRGSGNKRIIRIQNWKRVLGLHVNNMDIVFDFFLDGMYGLMCTSYSVKNLKDVYFLLGQESKECILPPRSRI